MFNNKNKKVLMILSWCWLLLPLTVLGHSTAQSSTLLVESKNGDYTFQVRASLAAFEYVVHEEYTAKGYANSQEFEALVLKLLSKHITLNIDGKNVNLTNPIVKLGHESLIVYQVNVPNDFQSVAIINTMFKAINKSKNLFIVLKNGVKKNLFTLDNSNNYATTVKVENNEFVIVSDTKSAKGISKKWYILPYLLLLGIMLIVIKFKPKKETVLKIIK